MKFCSPRHRWRPRRRARSLRVPAEERLISLVAFHEGLHAVGDGGLATMTTRPRLEELGPVARRPVAEYGASMYSSYNGGGGALFLLLFLGIGIAVGAGVGYWIAGQKNRDGVEGAALGCFLGPVGWIIEAVLPTKDPVPGRVANAYAPRDRSEYVRTETPGAMVPDHLQVPFWSHPDSQRPRGGRDGRPPFRSYTGATAQGAIDALVKSELIEHAKRGSRVVEAVWSSGDEPWIQAAFGDPGKQYALLFPDKPRVVWESQVRDEQTEVAPPPAATPATDPARPSMEPSGAAGPTKKCPDCAETVLADARICRFCRYEFWKMPA